VLLLLLDVVVSSIVELLWVIWVDLVCCRFFWVDYVL